VHINRAFNTYQPFERAIVPEKRVSSSSSSKFEEKETPEPDFLLRGMYACMPWIAVNMEENLGESLYLRGKRGENIRRDPTYIRRVEIPIPTY
jgi:hypothetical protein